MKIKGKIKCPKCESNNTHPWKIESTNIWDDESHETMINTFKENARVSGSTDNVIYNCLCEDCKSYFNAMVLMKVEVENICVGTDLYEIESIKCKELNEKIQKE